MSEGLDPVERMVALGFSQYEARAYLGLLGQEPMTGYALSNATGIPQPKVYETLRRLARKGVAVAVGGEPARFVALPPSQLLSKLDVDFRRRLADAEVGMMRAIGDRGGDEPRVLPSLSDWGSIERRAVELMDKASRHAYVSINCDERAAVIDAIHRADRRGIQSDILHFGPAALEVEHGRCLRHESTEHVVYRHHQARHLALVVDGSQVLWALTADQDHWDAVSADDSLLAAAVKGYVRHDIYVQQIAKDFGGLLEERYGPGLEELVVPTAPATDPSLAAVKPRGRARTA
ncbi:MAG: TrmB family transcriptional regulator [Acidimicrobiales bacterium]